MYIYFLVFIVIFASSLFLLPKRLNDEIPLRRDYCIGISLIFILLAGLRGMSVGPDTSMYKAIWDSFDDDTLYHYQVEFNLEVGFLYFMKYSKMLLGYQGFLILEACLLIIPVGFIIYKYSSNVILSFLLFYASLSFHTMSFSAQRQAIALGFMLIAYHFCMQRNLMCYLACCLVGFLFHRSCLIFLPCYWLYDIPLNRKVLFFWGIILAATFSIGHIILTYIVQYWRMQYSDWEEGAGGERLFALYAVFSIVGLYNIKSLKDNRTQSMPLVLFSLSPLLWPILNINPALYRLQTYFDFFLVLYIPNFLNASVNDDVKKIIYALSTFLMLYVLFKMRTVDAYYPYKFFWE